MINWAHTESSLRMALPGSMAMVFGRHRKSLPTAIRIPRFVGAVVCVVALATTAIAVAQGDSRASNDARRSSGVAEAGNQASATLSAVLQAVRISNAQARAELAQRAEKYRTKIAQAREKLANAEAKLKAVQNTSAALENAFDANEQKIHRLKQLLREKISELEELFGLFQQYASDLIGVFTGSPTSIQYPRRVEWLEAFAERMKDASEVSSVADIRRLWFEMMREIQASSRIVKLEAPVVGEDGRTHVRPLVRVGTFNLITDEPEPAYLLWQTGSQYIAELEGRPASVYLHYIDTYMDADKGLQVLGIDPAGGALLPLLAASPTLIDRIHQGGLIGYAILILGAVALLLALYKLVETVWIERRVRAQRRDLDTPRRNNALGRLLLTYDKYRNADPETVASRLDEQLVKERDHTKRFIVFFTIIAAVAPLMGLLGTIVGMINTFQAITLYGTGNPQTMAGGISQALVTTVEGLIVAVPTVFLHAVVSARAKAVIEILNQHVATLTGDRMAAESDDTEASRASRDRLQPSPT